MKKLAITILLFVFALISFSQEIGYSAALKSTVSNPEEWIRFEHYMRYQYLPDVMSQYSLMEDAELYQWHKTKTEKKQKEALELLEARRKGTIQDKEYHLLASIAALCGRYEWMKICLISGDAILPKYHKPDEFTASPLTVVISGTCHTPSDITLNDRISALDWMFSKEPTLIKTVSPRALCLAAQFSGINQKDGGAMFDYLISKGLCIHFSHNETVIEISTKGNKIISEEKIEQINHYGILLLLSVPDSLWVIQTHRLLHDCTKADLQKMINYLNEYPPTDQNEKKEYIIGLMKHRADDSR